jgi:P pilus assembly chaperone PapD
MLVVLTRGLLSSPAKRFKGRVRILALALSGCLIATPLAVDAQLAVDRLDLALTPARAGRVTGSILVSNESTAPVQASISREEWDRAENGDNRLLPVGTTGASCGDRLTVSPAVLRLEPHASERVRVSMNGTPASGKECWDIVYLEQALQQSPVRGNSLTYRFRTGVKIYVVPEGVRRDAQIEDMRMEGASGATGVSGSTGSPRQVSIMFHNTGGIHLLSAGRVEFRRFDNSVAAQIPIKEFPTLPGAVRKLAVAIPSSLGAGDYVVLALIDFRGSEIAAGQIELTLK